jgi:hypothetical protein
MFAGYPANGMQFITCAGFQAFFSLAKELSILKYAYEQTKSV